MNVRSLLEEGYQRGVRKFLQDNAREYDGKVHVSDVLGCLRKSYWYVKENPKRTANYNLFSGWSLHVALESVLKDGFIEAAREYGRDNFEVLTETEVSKGYLTGTPDMIIVEHKSDGDHVYVVELKTTKFPLCYFDPSSSYHGRVKGIREFAKSMKDKHTQQLQAYLEMVDGTIGKSECGILMYVNRSDGKYYLEFVDRAPKVFDTLNKRAEWLVECIKENKLPPAEPDRFCMPRLSRDGELICNCPFFPKCSEAKTKFFGNQLSGIADEDVKDVVIDILSKRLQKFRYKHIDDY